LDNRPDEELALGAVGGDVACFIALCHRHYPSLVAIAHAVLDDHQLSEDAAQEALAKACRSIGSLKSPRRFASWLAAICRNQARDMRRRLPTMQSLGDRDVAAPAPAPDAEIETVREAVCRLPAESRELLYLRYRNDLSYEAISDLLGISPQAVQGRLYRARQAVREHVERERKRRLS